MPDTRLIERWLPISALGIESTRERTPMTPFPAPNRLHVWWARQPLVAARSAVLASLLPADADRKRFLHVRGFTEIRWPPVTRLIGREEPKFAWKIRTVTSALGCGSFA